MTRRSRTFAITLLALLALPLASAQAQTLTVEPQPTTQPGAPPMPVVKVEDIDGGWTPKNTLNFFTQLFAAGLGAVGAYYGLKAMWSSKANKEEIVRQGDVQKEQLLREGTGTGDGKTPPPAV